MARARGRGVIARGLRALGFALLALALVLAVSVALFPFERLAPALSAQLSRQTGVDVQLGELEAGFGARGPSLAARDVALRWPTGAQLRLDSLRVRPVRPLAWLRGAPTAHVSLAAAFGSFDGEVSRERVAGEFTRFDLALLPQAWFGEAGAPLAGALDAQLDLALADAASEGGSAAWAGTLRLAGGEGSLALPGSPLAIPYERLDVDARLVEDGTIHLDALGLAGPMLVARASGAIAGSPAGPGSGEVAIDAQLERTDPLLLPAFAQYGIALDANGAGRVRVTGSAGAIQLR